MRTDDKLSSRPRSWVDAVVSGGKYYCALVKAAASPSTSPVGPSGCKSRGLDGCWTGGGKRIESSCCAALLLGDFSHLWSPRAYQLAAGGKPAVSLLARAGLEAVFRVNAAADISHLGSILQAFSVLSCIVPKLARLQVRNRGPPRGLHRSLHSGLPRNRHRFEDNT